MSVRHKFQLNSKDQQLFSFGKKFFGKKLDQIHRKKDFVQILKEHGLTDYLDRKIINNDLDHISRFSKNQSKSRDINQLTAPRSTKLSKNHNQLGLPESDYRLMGPKVNHFRNIKNPNKHEAISEKNYINNVLIKPKYNKVPSSKQKAPLQILVDFPNRDMRSMPILVNGEEQMEQFQRGIVSLNKIPSLNNLLFENDLFDESRFLNEIQQENKEMEEKLDFIKNYLGKENQQFKIRKPSRRATSFEPKLRSNI